MFCYKCGCELNSGNRCPNCGSDVQQYKKIIYTSNYLYNEGLTKAGVKDLSGAIIALKDAIWYNKNNLDARNLLGLCYYEIGETVAALSEWILSKNINDNGPKIKDNAADRYIAEIQASAQLVANQSAAIQRYNHALECCRSDNLDVAVLQLRKVLSLNSHYLRARQLLSLIYIEQQQWAKAQKELRKCQLLDVNNTTTLRYLNEVESKLSPDSSDGSRGKKKSSGSSAAAARALSGKSGRGKRPQAEGGVIKYTADNETIIQPAGSRIPGVDGFGFPSIAAGGIIGLLVGAALVAFLVMPTRVALVRSDAANQVREVSSQLDSKESEIADLQSQIEELQGSGGLTSGELSDDEASQVNALLAAANAYLADSSNDDGSVTSAFAQIDHQKVSGYSEAYQTLYNTLKAAIGSDMLDYYYLAGAGAYEAASPDYATAITNLENALLFDSESSPSKAHAQMLYYLGDSYYRSYLQGDTTDAAAAASTTVAEGDSEASGEGTSETTVTATVNKDDYIVKAETYLGQVVNNYADSSYASRAWADINAIAADETLKALAGDAFIEANTDAAATTADTVETDTAASEADAETGTVTPDATESSQAASSTSSNSNANTTATTAPAQTPVDNSAAEAEAAAAAAAAAQQEAERTAAAQAAYAQAIANGASSEEAMAAANAAIGN